MLTPVQHLENAESDVPIGIAESPVVTDERRASGRVYARLAAELSAHCESDVLACEAVDIGEGGICVEVPVSSGIMVGQRFEVVVRDDSGLGGLAQLFVDGIYATVVRTTVQPGADGPGIIAGLRFDQPLIFDGFSRVGSA
jgi:hypothetical protein